MRRDNLGKLQGLVISWLKPGYFLATYRERMLSNLPRDLTSVAHVKTSTVPNSPRDPSAIHQEGHSSNQILSGPFPETVTHSSLQHLRQKKRKKQNLKRSRRYGSRWYFDQWFWVKILDRLVPRAMIRAGIMRTEADVRAIASRKEARYIVW